MVVMSVCLAMPEGDLQDDIAQRILAIQADGRDAIVITTNAPAKIIAPALEERGVNMANLHIVDAITPQGKFDQAARTTYIGSPTMLELIGMRAERVAQRMNRAHLILYCVNSLRMYNDQEDVDRFMHYMASRVRSFDLSIEFIVRPGPDAEDLANRAETLLAQLAKT